MTVLADHQVEIDWSTSPRVVHVREPIVEIAIQDLVDTLREREQRTANLIYPQIISAGGKEPLGGGTRVGITMTLLNAVIRFDDRAEFTVCRVSGGNIVAFDEAGGELFPITPSMNVSGFVAQSSAATLQEQQDIQFSSYEGRVVIDVEEGTSGTDFPIGTARQPVNNITDALAIALARGLRIFRVRGELVILPGTEITGFEFEGDAATSQLIILEGSQFELCTLRRLAVVGSLLGTHILEECSVVDLEIDNAFLLRCGLAGDIFLKGTDSDLVNMFGCWSILSGDVEPTIDFDGNGLALNIRGYQGELALRNKAGAGNVSIDLVGSHLTMESTFGGTGHVRVSGVGSLVNEGSAPVDSSTLVNPDTVAARTLDRSLGSHVTPNTVGGVLGRGKIR